MQHNGQSRAEEIKARHTPREEEVVSLMSDQAVPHGGVVSIDREGSMRLLGEWNSEEVPADRAPTRKQALYHLLIFSLREYVFPTFQGCLVCVSLETAIPSVNWDKLLQCTVLQNS